MTVACASAKPSVLAPAAFAAGPLFAPAPVLAPAPLPYVAAHSSQVVARNYNGLAVTPVLPAVAPALVAGPAHFARFAPAPLPFAAGPVPLPLAAGAWPGHLAAPYHLGAGPLPLHFGAGPLPLPLAAGPVPLSAPLW